MRQIRKFKYILGVAIVVFLGFYFYLHANYYPSILMYHQIDKDIAQKNTIAVSPDVFTKQMAFIKSHNYKVVPLEELCRMLRRRDEIPHNLVTITFDDGYKNNLDAVKILNEYNFPATIFVVVNWIDKQGYLTEQDLEWIVKNSSVSLGSHTLNHRYLPDVPIEELRQEILGSKQIAKEKYDWDLLPLAYPIGGFTPEVLREVKEVEYLCACTTNRGFLRELDIYALRRIKVTNRDLGIGFWGKLTGFYNVFRRLKPPY